jgi:hypothetical protein
VRIEPATGVLAATIKKKNIFVCALSSAKSCKYPARKGKKCISAVPQRDKGPILNPMPQNSILNTVPHNGIFNPVLHYGTDHPVHYNAFRYSRDKGVLDVFKV